MESPGIWDLLTNSLAASDLAKPGDVFAFLVVQGLITGDSKALEAFVGILRAVEAEGEITGPSKALRVAQALRATVEVFPSADTPDPWARLAESRVKILNTWYIGGHDVKESDQNERSWWRFSKTSL